jgi:hypothetical protein
MRLNQIPAAPIFVPHEAMTKHDDFSNKRIWDFKIKGTFSFLKAREYSVCQ